MSALAELVRLHRAGQLVARYPDVAGLLAGLDGADLVQAGQLLSRLAPEDVLAAHPATPALTVAITGNGTAPGLPAALTAELARHGLLLRPLTGEFGGYARVLADPQTANADLVLCVLDPAVVFDQVPVPWTVSDVRAAFDRTLAVLDGLAGHATLVLNTIPLPGHLAHQLIDHRSRAELGAVWREANARLLRVPARHPGVVVIDLDPLVADGHPVSDARLRVYAGANLTAGLLASYARQVGHLARAITGRTKKVLALDLDETLWGGVLGEVGIEGIEVSGGRGDAFAALQRVVKQLGAQGVLLAAVSKNEPGPVREVLADHPDMILRDEDFVLVVANWEAKHANLTGLARVLNLDPGSFVFADDSAFERGLVRRELPGVTVLPLDAEPARHVDTLLRDGWFTVRELTGTDRARGAHYRTEARRAEFRRGFAGIEDYLAELEVRVHIAPAADLDLDRVAQLSLRTNQFNLTARRLQPGEVRTRAHDPRSRVLAVRAGDRFGDNGLVGAVFLGIGPDRWDIDNFLLSCRVFSRGIETACLAAVLRAARAAGVQAVLGHYTPTARNGRFADFYPDNGFAPVPGPGPAAVFRHDLAGIADPPAYVALTAGIEGALA